MKPLEYKNIFEYKNLKEIDRHISPSHRFKPTI